jgi:hypothetical protein
MEPSRRRTTKVPKEINEKSKQGCKQDRLNRQAAPFLARGATESGTRRGKSFTIILEKFCWQRACRETRDFTAHQQPTAVNPCLDESSPVDGPRSRAPLWRDLLTPIRYRWLTSTKTLTESSASLKGVARISGLCRKSHPGGRPNKSNKWRAKLCIYYPNPGARQPLSGLG